MVEQWTGTILDIDEESNVTLGFHGGNEIDRFNKLLNGVDLTFEENADVTIDTNWYFRQGKLKLIDDSGHIITLQLPGSMTTDRTITFPDVTATLATSLASSPNDFGLNMQQFVSGNIKIKDADQSHGITLKTSGLTANWDLTLQTPGHATDDYIITSIKSGQELKDKIITNPTFASMTFNIDSNILKHSTTNAVGDLLTYSTAGGLNRYQRLPKGTDGQILSSAAGGLVWIAAPAGVSTTDEAVKVYEGGVQIGSLGRKLNFDAAQFNITEDVSNNRFNVVLASVGSVGNSTTVFKNSITQSVANTVSETNLFSTSVAGGLMGTTGMLHIVVSGWILNDGGTTESFTFRLKLGATIIWQDNTESFSDATARRPLHMEFWIKNRNSASAQRTTGWYLTGNTTAAAVGFSDFAVVADNSTGSLNGIDTAINTGTSQTLSMTIIPTDIDPLLSVNAETILVEVIS